MLADLKTLASVDVDAFSLIDNHKFCGAKSRNFDKAIITKASSVSSKKARTKFKASSVEMPCLLKLVEQRDLAVEISFPWRLTRLLCL